MSEYASVPRNAKRNPHDFDRYYQDNSQDNSSKGVTLLVGVLVAIALVTGLMFFVGGNHPEQAQVAPQERAVNFPPEQSRTPAISPVAPAPANPAPAQPRQ